MVENGSDHSSALMVQILYNLVRRLVLKKTLIEGGLHENKTETSWCAMFSEIGRITADSGGIRLT